jgi:DNA-binding NarL/FixJ family response regulator
VPGAKIAGMGLKVAVVEDDALMRLAIVTALKIADLEVSFEAASGAEAVDKAKRLSSDAAVLDLHLGEGPTGLDVAQVMRRINPKLGLVFLTSFEDPRLLSAALPEIPVGAQYLTKGSLNNIQSLLDALAKSISLTSTQNNGSLGKLTNNQVEILKLVANGLSNSEISKQRFVTEKSVEVAISRIAKVLGLTSNSTQNQRVHIAQVYFRASGINFK